MQPPQKKTKKQTQTCIRIRLTKIDTLTILDETHRPTVGAVEAESEHVLSHGYRYMGNLKETDKLLN